MVYLKFQVKGVGEVTAPNTHCATAYQDNPESPWYKGYKSKSVPATWAGFMLLAHRVGEEWYFIMLPSGLEAA